MLEMPDYAAPVSRDAARKEGDLYKVITVFGHTFELRYGYYDDRDRQSSICEPAVIYPDFLESPLYTEEGEPLVTMMQDACEMYEGRCLQTPDTTCSECKHFSRGEEWFGLCKCSSLQRKNE